MKFAKLFDLESGEQVLVVKDYDSEKEQDVMTIQTDLDSCVVKMTLSFITEEARIKAFESYDIESAEKFRKSVESSASNLT